MPKNWQKISMYVISASMAVALSSCAPARVKKSDTDKTAQTTPDKTDQNFTPGVNVSEANLRGGEFVAVDGLAPVMFDYDSFSLGNQALETLKKNADYLKAHLDSEYLVAGYCDERGTIEYNLALGQKRSREVREYYIRLGVPGKLMATISYGKENPVCSESNESCWAQNRRAETRVRAQTASNQQPDAQ